MKSMVNITSALSVSSWAPISVTAERWVCLRLGYLNPMGSHHSWGGYIPFGNSCLVYNYTIPYYATNLEQVTFHTVSHKYYSILY